MDLDDLEPRGRLAQLLLPDPGGVAEPDGSGMQWSPRRAENVLALRLELVNDLWSEFEEHAIADHEKSDAWVDPRITPKGPQDVDPACLGAA